jgi:hypothetical protein
MLGTPFLALGVRREIRDRGFNLATLSPDERRAFIVICGRRKNAPLIRATSADFT